MLNIRKYNEQPTLPWSYWCPQRIGQEARLTMRFDFPEKTANGFLTARGLNIFNDRNGNYGIGSLWASKDAITWVQLIDAPMLNVGKAYSYDDKLPSSVLGAKTLWLQARLTAFGANIIHAQFLRNDVPGKCFSLKIGYTREGVFRISRIATNQVNLGFTGRAGSSVTIYTSTNLIDWLPLIGLPNPQGTLEFTDPSVGSFRQRFYRADSQ